MAKRAKKPTHVVKYDGETYRLPVVGRGRDISQEKKVDIARVVCLIYASDNHTLTECLAACGINSPATWLKWQRENEEIERLYQEAQAEKDFVYIDRLKARARTAAERLVEGYIVEVEEVEQEFKEGDNGDRIYTGPKKVRSRKIYVRPSAGLLQTILVNTDGQHFQRNPEPPADGDKIPTKIEIEISNTGHVPPVTSEDDINDDI